jgi:hypothetical protein
LKAIDIKRGSSSPPDDSSTLEPCDIVTFKPGNGVQEVLITTVQGGKNIRLDQEHPQAKISCAPSTLSEEAAAIWREISGGERATYSVAAISRGDQFGLPILSSDRSNLVLTPDRGLYIAWVGGSAPYRIQMRNAVNGRVVSEVGGIQGHAARIPSVSLPAGQYSLSVYDTPNDGFSPELREDSLFVVDASALPTEPPALRRAQLSDAERQILYVYYLEGIDHGRWAFEAMQRAAAITPPTAASTAWLNRYGGDGSH